MTEHSPQLTCLDAEAVDTRSETYGRRKVACESVVWEWQAKDLATVVLRPSVVCGAHGYPDRMAYWIWRATQGRPFLLPAAGLTVFRRA
ncbi:MAG: SDR family oxidoreductase [Candidatus Sericytochromatia bacterium]|nr:SDR family oxidoreductase [Candidatus Sericytochromatia bacterium]